MGYASVPIFAKINKLYASKKSHMATSIQTGLGQVVDWLPLGDIVKTHSEPSYFAETRSVWIDLSPSGLPDRATFFKALSYLIRGCRKHGIPFVMLQNNTNKVDGVDSITLPDWTNMCVTNNVKWEVTCCCQYKGSKAQYSSIRLRKKVFYFNTPQVLPSRACSESSQDKFKLHPCGAQMLWMSFMLSLVKQLCEPHRKVRMHSLDNKDKCDGTPSDLPTEHPASGHDSGAQRLPDSQIADQPASCGAADSQSAPDKTVAYPTDA